MHRGIWKIIQQGSGDAVIALDDDLFDDFFEDEEYLNETDLGLFAHEGYGYCLKVTMEYEVCGQCRGHGKVVDPSIDSGGITQEEFAADPDFRYDYFNGLFDIKCPECRGLRVSAIPKFPEWLQKVIDDHDRAEAEHIAEVCAERAMGA